MVIARGAKINDTTTTIFTKKAETSTTAQFAADADDIDTTPPSLAKLTTARSADELFQNVTRQFCQTGTDFTLNKEGLFVRRTLIDQDLQNPLPQSS